MAFDPCSVNDVTMFSVLRTLISGRVDVPPRVVPVTGDDCPRGHDMWVWNNDGSSPVWNNMFMGENFLEYSWNPPVEIKAELSSQRMNFGARSPQLLLRKLAGAYGRRVHLVAPTPANVVFAPVQGEPFVPVTPVVLVDMDRGLFCIYTPIAQPPSMCRGPSRRPRATTTTATRVKSEQNIDEPWLSIFDTNFTHLHAMWNENETPSFDNIDAVVDNMPPAEEAWSSVGHTRPGVVHPQVFDVRPEQPVRNNNIRPRVKAEPYDTKSKRSYYVKKVSTTDIEWDAVVQYYADTRCPGEWVRISDIRRSLSRQGWKKRLGIHLRRETAFSEIQRRWNTSINEWQIKYTVAI